MLSQLMTQGRRESLPMGVDFSVNQSVDTASLDVSCWLSFILLNSFVPTLLEGSSY